MTAAIEGREWSAAHPGCTLPPAKSRYPFYRRLGGPQGRSGRAKNLVPTEIRSRTVQPVVSRYTDWATRPTIQDGILDYTRQKYSEFTSVIFIASCRFLYYSTRCFVPFFSSAVQLLVIDIGVKLILWFPSFQRRALYRFELLVSSAVACTSQEVTYEVLVPFSSSSLPIAGSATSRHLHRFPCSLTGSCHLIVPLCFATMLTVLCDIILQFIN